MQFRNGSLRFVALKASGFVRVWVGASLLVGLMGQPAVAQGVPPLPSEKVDVTVGETKAAPAPLISSAPQNSPPITPPENKPDPREPAPPQQLDLKYEEKDWTQPVDPNATVDEDLHNPKIKKNTTDYMTATLPITDVRGLGETIRVELRLESTRVVPGGELRGTVYVGSGQAQPEVGLVLNLPKGLDYVADSAPNASFDAKTGALTWQMNLDESGLATLPFVLRVLPTVKREALKLDVKPLAQGNDKRNYQMGKPAKLRVADADARAELDSKGGTLSVDEGRVVLDFGEGVLKEPRQFVASVFKTDLGKQAERDDGTQGTAEDFSPLTLEVTPDTTFEAPITAIVNLSGLIPAEMLAKGLVPELRYARPGELDVAQTDAKGEQRMVQAKGVDYETVPGNWDPITQKLTVLLSHFSTYPVGFSVPSGAPQPWKLGANLGDVSLFRGSMNWSLPIAVPSLPGGAPGLSIAYSSAGADSFAGRMESSDYRLGWGWDLNGVPVIQQGVKANHAGPGFGESWYEVISDTQFRLSLGGQDYNLVYKSTTNGADEYVPENYGPVRAVRCKTGNVACNGWQINIPTWTEGTMTGIAGCSASNNNAQVVPAAQYYWQVWTADGLRYVFGTDASSTQHMQQRNGNGSSGKITYQKWYLTRVVDPVRDGPSGSIGSADYTYTEAPRTGDNGESQHQQCDSRGADWEPLTRLAGVSYGNSQSATPRPYKVTPYYSLVYGDLMRLISMTVQSNNADVRRYLFGFNGNTNDQRLSSITEQGWNGGGWVQLPATTFEYSSNSDYTHNQYGMVYRINNGYGGRVEHSYNWWTAPIYYKSFNTVSFRRFVDGLGNTSQEQYDFVNGTQCYNDITNNIPSACNFGRDALFPEGRNGIMGFGQVWKRVSPNGGATLSTVKVDQHINKRWLGKPAYVRNYTAMNGSVLSAQVNYYGLTEPAPSQPTGTWLTWLGTQDEFPQSDATYSGNFFMKRTETLVDGLGNPTEIREYGYYNLIGDERTTYMGYATPNWSNWVVGKLGYEERYAGVVGQSALVFKNQTVLYYDGNTNWSGTLSLGQLKKVGRGNSGLGGSNWAVQNFGYDGAGNLNVMTDPRGYSSFVYYDDATLKPLWTDSPLWLGYSYARTYYHYFGRNGVGHPGGQPWGEYHYTTDANSQLVNRVWYDPYGRVTSVVQPLDSDAEPTQKYVYGDAGQASVTAPLKIETQQRENCNGCYISTLSFYDGLGRAVQTRAEAPNSKQRVTNITYDALGRTLRQYVPAEENAIPNYDRPTGWNTRPNTLSAYDLLGRPTSVTGPDGIATTMAYDSVSNMARTTVTNGLAVPKRSLSDGLGQLKQVQECHDDTLTNGVQCNWQTTTYNYDAVYGLTSVTDAMNNGTTMGYDWLGRKTSMNDPDMGIWSYSYDANGNLISQTDAKSPAQVLTFAYDSVNRMTDKYVNGTWTSWNRFDETGNTAYPIGRRTRMGHGVSQGTNWSNETYFYYDARGRMTKEHRAVDGVGWFDTQYAYDSADRVTTMTYPDGEVVNSAYDAAGQPYSLAGTNTYVGSASYNALGQPTVFNLGNTRSQRWYYFGSNLSAPHVKAGGNINWNYGKLRQTCVLATSLGDCFDWTVRTGGSSNTQLNLYNNYDDAGNVAQVYDRGTNGSPNDDHVYGYDALDRLMSWKMNTVAQQSYTYDVIGNLKSKDGLGNLGYNPSGPGSVRPHAARYLNGVEFYAYDNNGNMTIRNDNGTYYQNWNADNKLVSMSGPPGSMTIAYDADGARTKTVVNGVTTAYVGNHYEVKDTPNAYVNVTFAKTVGVSVAGSTLTRNDGQNNWGGSGASSTAFCAGSGYCSAYASAAATNTNSMFGLSNVDSDASYPSIRYGLHLQGTGTALIYEFGVNKGAVGSYAVGDKFTVQAEPDNRVRYYKLPAGSGSWQLLYTSADIPTYPLRMDSSIYNNGGKLVDMQMHGTQLKTTTSYYYFGGQRVAMRTPTDGVQWLHSDHLGSSSTTTTNTGGVHAWMRYKPFGEVRTSGGTLPTNRKFNGNVDDGFGTLHYGAREYVPLLGRFLSADSVIDGGYGTPIGLNRYAYTRNNPLKYTDPTGHWIETAFDIVMLGVSIAEFVKEPSLVNGAAVALDAVSTVLPIVPAGGGLAIRALTKVDDVVDAAKALDKATTADKGADAVKNYFRGDGRPPEQIFSEGFQSKGTNTNLEEYVNSNAPSAWVGTSKNPNVARADFAASNDGWVYTSKMSPSQGIDVNANMGPHTFDHEMEVVFPGGIPTQNILGARKVDPKTEKFAGPFIPNPNYGSGD